MIGEPTERGIATDLNTEGRHLSHSWSVHSIASRQNEARYQLECGKHVIQPFGTVLADRENDSCTDGGSIHVCHCVRSRTKFLLISAGEQCPTLQWYEKFNTKVDVGLAISITQQHKVLLEYMAQENHTMTFAALSAKQKQAVREDAEEHYISYAFLHQSGAQHGNLKVDLWTDFTTGSNRYPKTHQQTAAPPQQVQQDSCCAQDDFI